MGALMKLWHWLVGGGLLALAASSTARAAPDGPGRDTAPTGGGGPTGGAEAGGYPEVRRHARELGELMGWSRDGIKWFENWAQVQAYSESRGNLRPDERKPANRTPSEARAAKRAWEQVRGQGKIPGMLAAWPQSDWDWGSGGWFGLLPAYGLQAFNGDEQTNGRPLGPYDVFDPRRSTVMMLAFIDRLMGNRFGNIDAGERNAYALKRGMAAGSLVAKPDADRSKISHKHLDAAVKALKLPANFGSQRIPSEISKTPPSWAAIVRQWEAQP